jgi:ribonuclease HII
MKLVSNRTWNIAEQDKAGKIKEWLLSAGGKEDRKITSTHELWRIKFSDATITFYKKGTLFITDSNDEAVLEAHNFIDSLLGSKFIASTKKFLIGFDETGKGEVLGHTVLVGVLFPVEITSQLERDIGVADSKVKHKIEYWDDIFRKIDFYQSKGLRFLIQKIPPWQFDKYNINKLLDITYQRMLLLLARGISLNETRIVFDDYGIGFNLERYLKSLGKVGAEVIRTSKADDNYLESRVASLIAKREQQKVIDAISRSTDFQLSGASVGSGNAGDPATLKWLNTWKLTKKEWPWFVKRSFKTIRDIDGITQELKKFLPPLNESLLCEEFRKRFESGELNMKALSIVCPCGAISKAIKLTPQNNQTTPICIACKREIINISLTLQYYCGRIMPDSSAIARGFISKDLEGRRFFENFTFILHPTVRYESDNHPGGKKELERIGYFSAIGRIRLEEIRSIFDATKLDNLSRDESILQDAITNNAIILTADGGMKGAAQAKDLFVMELA